MKTSWSTDVNLIVTLDFLTWPSRCFLRLLRLQDLMIVCCNYLMNGMMNVYNYS